MLCSLKSSPRSDRCSIVRVCLFQMVPYPNKERKVKQLALFLLRFYRRFISRALPPSCRFTPTCSVYAYEAIDRYGFFKGGWMGIKRVARCNPFNPGGYDPVP